jgi:uncharacterized phiE125 gp8 family phage protein
MARLELYDNPTQTVVSTAEAKSQLRVTHTGEDTYIASLVAAATEMAENYVGGHFINHAYNLYLESWDDTYVSNAEEIKGFWTNTLKSPVNLKYGGYFSKWTGLYQLLLTRAPLYSVEHIKYYDTSNTQQTWSDTNYNVMKFANQKGFVEIVDGQGLPDLASRADAVEVRYHSGYGTGAVGASKVPSAIKQAILLIVGHLYEKREDSVSRLPKASEYMLDPYKIQLY